MVILMHMKIRLIGHSRIIEKLFELIFDPRFSPIVAKHIFLRKFGTLILKPNRAEIVHKTAGPKMKGAGIWINHANNAPVILMIKVPRRVLERKNHLLIPTII